nr:immunoglobulin light chain junction region [Macaca mulatta]
DYYCQSFDSSGYCVF